ncbi:General substrate transporter [Metarhizium album ARSEF 1941]|uniref:General substrate transporter n=1 Tax=Metarhizium album (strain ARSEF 1941) TaxID=1081103 RepID=A0A0B2WQD6_METAS|nr:General substrate transporter [Metarhizium album ARSEF 1941]KHN95205.1 General substrate transporter [Metarhizium album ARSEF 1941]
MFAEDTGWSSRHSDEGRLLAVSVATKELGEKAASVDVGAAGDAVGFKDEQIAPQPVSKASSVLMVLVGGLALFSDGYNAQTVGYMNTVLSQLHPEEYTKDVKTRVSNAFPIGEVFGMLFSGWAIDRLGRRNGIFWATLFLVLGLVLSAAAHGTTLGGMFWMMIVGRGVAGFGAGGE